MRFIEYAGGVGPFKILSAVSTSGLGEKLRCWPRLGLRVPSGWSHKARILACGCLFLNLVHSLALADHGGGGKSGVLESRHLGTAGFSEFSGLPTVARRCQPRGSSFWPGKVLSASNCLLTWNGLGLFPLPFSWHLLYEALKQENR